MVHGAKLEILHAIYNLLQQLVATMSVIEVNDARADFDDELVLAPANESVLAKYAVNSMRSGQLNDSVSEPS